MKYYPLKWSVLLLGAILLTSCEKKEVSVKKSPITPLAQDNGSKKPAPTPPPVQEPKKPDKPKPNLKPKPASTSSTKERLEKIVEQQYPEADIKPLDEITKNWTAVPANAYPQEVTAKIAVPLDLMMNGQKVGKSEIKAGQPLKPLKLTGDQLLISSVTNEKLSSEIPVSETNFKQLIQKRYDDFVISANKKIREKREKARKILIAQEKEAVSSSSAAPSGVSYRPSSGQRISEGDPRLVPVIASIKKGALPMKLSEVNHYSWNGEEILSGDLSGMFETVNVSFTSVNMFGKFHNEYKCLLKGKKVIDWIDPITQEKIRR